MGKIWLRTAWGVLLAALLVLTIASWKMIGVVSEDESEESERAHMTRHVKAERNSVAKSIRASVDTAELRNEALLILGRVEEYSDIMDILPETARLSAIFRQWGEVDFEEAKRFLETEELAKKRQRPDRSFADDLILAAIIGYSKSDPIKAWEEFLPTQDYSDQPLMLGGIRPYPHEVAAGEIMRALFKKSQIEALAKLRSMDPSYEFLILPSLRAIISESNDPVFRAELMKEFFETNPKIDGLRAGVVCAGLAEHDPKSASDYLFKIANSGVITQFDPMLTMYYELIHHWSQSQPQEALRFISEMEKEEYQTQSLETFFTYQSNYRPELIVEALEMDSLKKFQSKVLPDVCVRGLKKPVPWPLIDENVPVSLELRYEKLQEAVESSKLPESLKDRFLTAIEAERGK